MKVILPITLSILVFAIVAIVFMTRPEQVAEIKSNILEHMKTPELPLTEPEEITA